MNRLLIYLIRKRLGLKKYQKFYLKNQAQKSDRYYFTDDGLMKNIYLTGVTKRSNMSLNYLLSNYIINQMVKE